MATTFPKKSELSRAWHVVDAEGLVLGRLASRIARILTGKHKPTYVPFLDTGDHVIVINADKVVVTGNKEHDKIYYRYSGYPGGITASRVEDVRTRFPERLIESAVRGMLPKNRVGRAQIKKLKVYRGAEHPHRAQQPSVLAVQTRVAR